MLATLLARFGLQALAGYLIPTLLGLLLTGAVGASWWMGYADLSTMIYVGLIAALVASIFTFKSPVLQFLALGGIVVLCYMLGRHEEGKNVEAKVDAAVAIVHDEYAAAKAREEARLAEEARKARERAEAERKAWQAQIDQLLADLDAAKAAAEADEHAERPAFSLDAVNRLNAFRGNRLLSGSGS